jgi:hypothetical protein
MPEIILPQIAWLTPCGDIATDTLMMKAYNGAYVTAGTMGLQGRRGQFSVQASARLGRAGWTV